jgi:hypothetical protein
VSRDRCRDRNIQKRSADGQKGHFNKASCCHFLSDSTHQIYTHSCEKHLIDVITIFGSSENGATQWKPG